MFSNPNGEGTWPGLDADEKDIGPRPGSNLFSSYPGEKNPF